jgi:hypothetical protein
MGCVSTRYAERVEMREGVSLVGGYHALTPDWVVDPTCETVIVDQDHTGVRFPSGLTNATMLTGFSVLGYDDPGSSAAISVEGGGTVATNYIKAAFSAQSVGIVVSGSGNPTIRDNEISGPTTVPTQSIAIFAGGPALIENNRITAEDASATSWAVVLEDAPGTILRGNAITAGDSPSSRGIHIVGDTSGISIEGNPSISGGEGTPEGIHLEGCDGTAAAITGNARIVGGAGATVFGIAATTGCAIRVEGNTEIVAMSRGTASLADAIHCSGSGTRCDVRNNGRIVGTDGTGAATTARGVRYEGGAVGDVTENASIVGCTSRSASCGGVEYADATSTRSVVDRNVFDENLAGMWSGAIRTVRSAVTVSNNLVFVDGGIGISFAVGGATSSTEPVAHSNTVIQPADATSTRETTLMVSELEGGSPAGAIGIWRNNIAACLATTRAIASFAELGSGSRPRYFENNDLYGCSGLYRVNLTGILLSVIDTLSPGHSGNLSVDPSFVGPSDYHLSPTSPVIGQGTASTVGAPAPSDDFDAEPRPSGMAYEIGFDEVP